MTEKGRHTDTPLHKTFRDPTEIDARSNRKKEFKTDGLHKRACCVLVYSFFRSIQFKDSKFQNEIPKQQFLFLCWLSYLCFILRHLIQEEEDTI